MKRRGEGLKNEIRNRIRKLDLDLAMIFFDDLEEAIRNRLKVLEKVQENRNRK